MGLNTFGDINADPAEAALSHANVIRNVIDEACLADQAGVDFFGVGEHHRADFAISSPEVLLGTIAGRTTHIHLGSSVTVLSADDPVRVFERFSTLHAASSGRAEVILGRGWFTEPFELFGHDRSQYDALFDDKLGSFMQLLRRGTISRQAHGRPFLADRRVFPPVETAPLRAWLAVGSTPESVLRAVRQDLPMMLAVIGGEASRFRPLVDLYHRAFQKLGKQPREIGVHSTGYVAGTDEQAREAFWASYQPMRDRIGAERGWQPIGRSQFIREVEQGSLYVGAPETVARKIAATLRSLGACRFDMKYSVGRLSHGNLMSSIELFGSKVIPLVRDMMADSASAQPSGPA
jgi:probable LLM family oxidoreductase